MAPIFKPRQRKRKVLDRQRVSRKQSAPEEDSNAVEYVPPATAAVEEQKRQIKEELRKQGTKLSGKKAKRLEKFIETKLKKDENKILLGRAAKSTIDTSLFQSSSKLGQGKETQRERLSRALADRQAGVDIQGDISQILRRKLGDEAEDGSSSDDGIGSPILGPQSTVSAPTSTTVIGAGLKRPLEVDEEGRPLLKKRKRRGGVDSKLSFKHKPIPEPEWEGFSSASGLDTEDDETDESHSDDSADDASEDDAEEVIAKPNGSSDSDSDSDSNDEKKSESSSDDDDDEEDNGVVKERSSAFKAWANQQLNEALGYEPVSIMAMATQTQNVEGFERRAPEQDPLPLELQPTKNLDRKVASVTVERLPELQQARLKLPVVADEQKIMEAIHESDVVVICGATGSGKTTQVPQFLFEAGYGSSEHTPGMIGITQPRRVAAVSMSKRVGDELGNHGKKVAFQIRFEGTVGSQTAMKFMTDGVLLREVSQDFLLKEYSAIIIDEAHERSLNTDILIAMLSRVIRLRNEEAATNPDIKPLKLIIMSATLRVTDFTANKTLFSTPPPVLEAEGRQFTVTTHFARKTHHDYVEELFRKIGKGHKKLPPGAFLVFLTGQNEITQLSKKLKEEFSRGSRTAETKVSVSGKDRPIEAEDVDFGDFHDDGDNLTDDEADVDEDEDEFNVAEEGEELESGPSKMHILPLYSMLPNREQLRVFDPPPEGSRLVVLATNVAETSLTIPGVRYVFDCGRSKERKYDQTTGVQSFEVGWISKASASQRAGRAGRTGPGHCYKLYSSAVYERDFEEFTKPEILRMPIEGVVLQLKSMNLQKIANFPFPTPPDRKSLENSEKLLKYLTAINPAGKITPTGATMSIFPLSPRFSRVLLVGHLHDCLQYTIAMVAALSAADFFIPDNQVVPAAAQKEEDTYFTNEDRIQEEARNSIRRKFNKVQKDFCFLDDKSDAIKLLQVVGEFAHEPTEEWCRSHFVRFKVLKEIQQLRGQITNLLKSHILAFAGLKFQDKLPPPSAKQVKALKQMVAAGFIDHIAMRADLAPNPPTGYRKPSRAIDVPYLTLSPSHLKHDEEDKAVYIHPSSPLAHLSITECPSYIIYSYLQRVVPTVEGKIPKARMHALTDVTGNQLAALAKGTPLLDYGKPIKEISANKSVQNGQIQETRECWIIPYLKAEGVGGVGWPLPARKVIQKKMPGKEGWVVQ
ncbi:DEAH-box RNA helicase [Calycina marina]|uniref:RNA helicase n=1 Tax=Calycina marina TaxID=1763456 RepID=A0A9P7ZBN5_9HELO|nr:DEAH-box RNA helicase [Calycina marina]